MFIKKMIRWHRRDFTAIYECEYCGDSYESSGYDDKNFHENIIPTFECKKCGKMSNDDYVPLQARYEEWEQV